MSDSRLVKTGALKILGRHNTTRNVMAAVQLWRIMQEFSVEEHS